ncbi:YesL family protein [Anaerobacillus arseniciselenatis]|nr:YesL family protein [Anaerobacillus arseniciselenatis]
MNYVTSFLYRICEWIMRLAYVNILWIAFSFVGLLVLGVFPATIAMFSVVRKWMMNQSDIPIFKTFWQSYKKDFFKGNIIGWIFVAIGYVLYIQNSVIMFSDDPLIQISKYAFFLLVILFSLVTLYLFPTYVHYNVSLFQVVKNAFLIMVINPINNIIMILGLVLFYYILLIIPQLLVFFGASVVAYIIMWSCFQSFLNIDKKKKRRLVSG